MLLIIVIVLLIAGGGRLVRAGTLALSLARLSNSQPDVDAKVSRGGVAFTAPERRRDDKRRGLSHC